MRKAINSSCQEKLWNLFVGTLRAHRISVPSGLEMAVIAGLEKLGVKVDPSWLKDESEEIRGNFIARTKTMEKVGA